MSSIFGDNAVCKSSDKPVFIDRNSIYFEEILEYLRSGEFAPNLKDISFKKLLKEMDYYMADYNLDKKVDDMFNVFICCQEKIKTLDIKGYKDEFKNFINNIQSLTPKQISMVHICAADLSSYNNTFTIFCIINCEYHLINILVNYSINDCIYACLNFIKIFIN